MNEFNVTGVISGRFSMKKPNIPKPGHIIYQSNLQIVSDIDRHELLKKVHLEQFPTAIIITPDVLKLLHEDSKYKKYIQQIHNNHINGVYYMLSAGTHGAPEGYHCNGVRYGSYPADYISLTHFKQFGE